MNKEQTQALHFLQQTVLNNYIISCKVCSHFQESQNDIFWNSRPRRYHKIHSVYKGQSEDCLLLDQMFFNKKTGYCHQDNCEVLNFWQIKIYHLGSC